MRAHAHAGGCAHVWVCQQGGGHCCMCTARFVRDTASQLILPYMQTAPMRTRLGPHALCSFALLGHPTHKTSTISRYPEYGGAHSTKPVNFSQVFGYLFWDTTCAET